MNTRIELSAAANNGRAMEAESIHGEHSRTMSGEHSRTVNGDSPKTHRSRNNFNFAMIVAIAAIFAVTTLFISGCGGSKQATDYKPKAGSPFGDVYDAPCSEPDTDEYFVGLGIANGSRNRMDVLQTSALTNAQNVARQKMQHAYKGAIDDYSNYMGNNMGSDAQAKVERGGTQIIDRIINDTKAWCGPKFSGVDEKGDVSCYIGIRISKQQLAQAITNHLSNDEELKIRFNEQEFRKRMDESFKKFKEN